MFELVVLYGVVCLSATVLAAFAWNAYSSARNRAREHARKKLHARELALQLHSYSEKFLDGQSPPRLGRRAANLAIERARELQYATLPEFGDEMVAVLSTYERLSDSQWRRHLLRGEQLGQVALDEPSFESLQHDHALAVEVLLSRCEGVAGPMPREPKEAAPMTREDEALTGPVV
jgi:hypothetical protein